MIPKINIEYLKNEKYIIAPTYNKISEINFLDFQHTLSTTTASPYYSTIGLNASKKILKLRSISIEIPFDIPFLQHDNNLLYQQLFFNIKSTLDKEFCKKITELGEKHKNLDLKFDIDISGELRKNKNIDITRYIFGKLFSASNYIATQGRIGGSHYFLSNKKTYNYILSYLSTTGLIYTNNNLIIGNSAYMIDDEIDEDIIIAGRKNDMTQPGVHCIILTDTNKDIYFDQIQTFQGTKLIMYYDIFDVGNNPEYQYFQINTRTLSYYRKKKLDKIKQSIKNN